MVSSSSVDLPPQGVETSSYPSSYDMRTWQAQFAAKAADRLTEFRDLQSIIVRRFDNLALRNILYLHARLAEIDNPPEFLTMTPPSPSTAELERTQQLLADYHEAIIRYSEVLKLSRPPVGYVRDLLEMLSKGEADHYDFFIKRQFLERKRLFADLVALSPFADPLTRFISSTPLSFFCLDILGSVKQGKTVISLPRIRRFVAALQALISIGFLVGAMRALYKLTDMITRLAVVSGFVGGFCFWLAVTTDIKKRDVFAATAAYAAVLVVYVGSTGDGNSSAAACSCPPGAA